ncbi:MAG: type II toxin-antitoxin system RelE/ParE family toxin [Clostridia bacterium]
MFNIVFYQDASGKSSVQDYLDALGSRKDKDSRIKLNKILEYVYILRELGTRAGEPYVKHLAGEIWELRPLRDRILFAAWVDGQFVLLTQFMKQTQQTPKREIERAIRALADLKERSEHL